MYQNQYVLAGVSFSEKSGIYLLAAQLLFSNGLESILAGLIALSFGFIYTQNLVRVQSFRLPGFVEVNSTTMKSFCFAFALQSLTLLNNDIFSTCRGFSKQYHRRYLLCYREQAHPLLVLLVLLLEHLELAPVWQEAIELGSKINWETQTSLVMHLKTMPRISKLYPSLTRNLLIL